MNLRQIRKKIKAVNNIKKITNAMELISSIKMKRAQGQYKEGKLYRDFLHQMVTELADKLEKEISPFLKEGEGTKNLYLVISSNKGLCGNFNFAIFRKIYKEIDLGKGDFIVYGKKGAEFINRSFGKILADFSSYKLPSVIPPVFDYLLKTFLSGEYQNVFIVYNRFISSTVYEPTIEKIIPLTINKAKEEISSVTSQYIIEPSPKEILDSLIKDSIEQKIRDCFLSSQVSEHASRMIAMKNATDNAKEIGYKLTLIRNKLRQEKITYELLDMITAKESIDKNN